MNKQTKDERGCLSGLKSLHKLRKQGKWQSAGKMDTGGRENMTRVVGAGKRSRTEEVETAEKRGNTEEK